MVEPLFDDMSTSVCAGSTAARSSRTRTGESESSVLNETRFLSCLLYLVMVMGACVEPPWPTSTTVSTPPSTAASANACTFSMGNGGIEARSVQPMNASAHARASSEKS